MYWFCRAANTTDPGGTRRGATPRRRSTLMDEAATHATIAGEERIDGFELCVGDRRLGDRCEVLSVDEGPRGRPVAPRTRCSLEPSGLSFTR
jgi:hypothetical protein